ncbi:hypothetical protein ON010_g4475 [Phytophthora cinnamomi]|nr:hypothetical protein ON010_g4475 [Phytophthora cinnamomi]
MIPCRAFARQAEKFPVHAKGARCPGQKARFGQFTIFLVNEQLAYDEVKLQQQISADQHHVDRVKADLFADIRARLHPPDQSELLSPPDSCTNRALLPIEDRPSQQEGQRDGKGDDRRLHLELVAEFGLQRRVERAVVDGPADPQQRG